MSTNMGDNVSLSDWDELELEVKREIVERIGEGYESGIIGDKITVSWSLQLIVRRKELLS